MVLLASKPCQAVLLAQLVVPDCRCRTMGRAPEAAEHRIPTGMEVLMEVHPKGI